MASMCVYMCVCMWGITPHPLQVHHPTGSGRGIIMAASVPQNAPNKPAIRVDGCGMMKLSETIFFINLLT